MREAAQLPRRSDHLEALNLSWNLADTRGRLKIWKQTVQGPPRLLYKYRPLSGDFAEENLRDIIVRSEFRLSAVEELNDPFEVECRMVAEGSDEARRKRIGMAVAKRGLAPAQQAMLIAELMTRPQEYFQAECQRAFNDIRGSMGIYCLAASARLSPMWAYYADNYKGICVIFNCVKDFPLLTRVVPIQPENSNAIPTLNYYGDIEAQVLKVFAMKQSGWQHEKEFRLIAFMQARKYIFVRPDAVRGIILGMKIPPQGLELVRALLAERAAAQLPKLRVFECDNRKDRLELAIRVSREISNI